MPSSVGIRAYPRKRSIGLERGQDRAWAGMPTRAIVGQSRERCARLLQFGDLAIERRNPSGRQCLCPGAVFARIEDEQFVYFVEREAGGPARNG
jgi:hypothetical protein